MQPQKLSEERLEYYRNEHLTVTETSFLQHIAYQDQRIKELEDQSALAEAHGEMYRLRLLKEVREE